MTRRLRKRPEAAFESLYRRHVHDVYRYALALLGSRADAEDVTQTTFLNAFRAYERGEIPRRPGNWLRAITHNVCRQRFRQAARRPQELPMLDDVGGGSVVEESERPSAADIARALSGLPFNQRAALVMRELEGRRQAEIADTLGVSISAVETLLFRARRALREQLESSLTCSEAAQAVSRQLDGPVPRAERAALRAHLRHCRQCAAFARSARAQRGALRRLGAISLPSSLVSWSGAVGGAGAVTVATTAPATGVGLKLAVGVAAAVIAAGAGDDAVRTVSERNHNRPSVSAAQRATVPAARIAATRTVVPAVGATFVGSDVAGSAGGVEVQIVAVRPRRRETGRADKHRTAAERRFTRGKHDANENVHEAKPAKDDASAEPKQPKPPKARAEDAPEHAKSATKSKHEEAESKRSTPPHGPKKAKVARDRAAGGADKPHKSKKEKRHGAHDDAVIDVA
jgi:RNA polymerase sigma factor (sigma-70 family)